MAGPGMSNDQYRKLTPWQKRFYWGSIAAAVAVISYLLFFYRQ